jgi:predicted GNAT superfamily acetyltransferase
MKRPILLISLLFSTFYSIAQIVTTKGDKLEVRDINGKFISSGYYSNMADAVAGDNIVVIWFTNDKIEIKSEELKFISSGYYSNLKKVATSGAYVVLYFTNNKIEVRDMKLKFISSWYQ